MLSIAYAMARKAMFVYVHTSTVKEAALPQSPQGFTDQCTVSETSFGFAKVIKDLVDDLDGFVNCISIALGGGSFGTSGDY